MPYKNIFHNSIKVHMKFDLYNIYQFTIKNWGEMVMNVNTVGLYVELSFLIYVSFITE